MKNSKIIGKKPAQKGRVIVETDTDGIYILREDFKADWESAKVKRFEHIFDDIVEIIKSRPSI